MRPYSINVPFTREESARLIAEAQKVMRHPREHVRFLVVQSFADETLESKLARMVQLQVEILQLIARQGGRR